MKRFPREMYFVVVAALGISLVAIAVEHEPSATPAPEHEMGKMHRMSEMDAGTKMRMMVFMKAKLDQHDPATAMALKDELKLTDEQVDRLKQIHEQARAQAAEVLTEEQREQLKALAETPPTMEQMREKLIEKMKSEGKMMYTCPMHPEVKQSEAGKCPQCGMDLEVMACPICQMGMMMEHKKEKSE